MPKSKFRLRPLAQALIGAFGALTFVVAVPATAHANVLTLLPQNADGLEQTFSPAYDYDGDGCYATAAIGADGALNPGLKLGGDVNGKCHDPAQLANANTYSRAKCNNGWCAVMYASYFEKDQATLGPAAIGHRHDWEHVVVWVNNDQVQYVSVSQHSGYQVAARSSVRFDGSHPKIVYHKDGISTHCFRFAGSNDEPAENATGNWFFPRLVGWNGYPAGYRDKLIGADFGSATLKIDDGDFPYHLAASKPSGIAFDPYA
ncbi:MULTISPECIES: NPP1 family protein [unclassified Streptomyces]|uniref:NPP1 family protein n=1 Tax=unclassified Streptomyces TaxID=2593676 RepID=UPI00225226C0|nr:MULTISPECIES: NPP1 family protein [unclassified Streptomyces]MCX5329808.1 NPP1 family protein [Streptomyces sp. NBC_00140]MCX5359223.1 NPP1 family protein [Streptomyces sp. NBC_00124]